MIQDFKDASLGALGALAFMAALYAVVGAYCTANPYHYRVDDPASRWESVAHRLLKNLNEQETV